MVSDYLGNIINIVSILVFSRIVLKQKSNIAWWKTLLMIILIAIVLQVFRYFDITIFKTCIMFVLFAVLVKLNFSMDISKTIILTFIYYIVLILADMISINLLSMILGEKEFYLSVAGGIIGSMVVFVITVLLSFIFRKLILKILNIKIRYRMLFVMIFSIVCIIALFYATFRLGTNSADKLLCIFSIFVLVLVIGNSFMQAYKNNQLILQYDNLLSFIKKYETEIDNQRTMRHETKNQLLTIKSKIIDKEKPTAIVDYIDTILNDGRKINHAEYAKLKYLPSNGLKGLFYFKMITAEEKNIHVEVSIAKGIEDGFLSKLDTNNFNQIGKVLGVYLDNAIESAEITKKKSLCIEAFTKTDEVIFVISNTYDPNVKKIGRSTKGVGRGYGLLLANSIISNNSRLSSSTEVTPEVYIKKLSIKK